MTSVVKRPLGLSVVYSPLMTGHPAAGKVFFLCSYTNICLNTKTHYYYFNEVKSQPSPMKDVEKNKGEGV